MPILLTLQGVSATQAQTAFIVSLNTVGFSKGVETDPRIFVGFPARELPPPTHSQHPHMGSPTHGHTPQTESPLQGSTWNPTDYDTVLEKVILHPGPLETQRPSWGTMHNLGQGE